MHGAVLLLLSLGCSCAWCFSVRPLFAAQPLSEPVTDEDDATVISVPYGPSLITLVGTAHLSKKSNEQVENFIATEKPDVVMVELDKSRIERIGFTSLEEIGLPVVTADDIVLPYQKETKETTWWKVPQAVALDLFLDAFKNVARKLLTGMYDDMSEKIQNEDGPGGEFLTAIRAGKQHGASRIVLGDRESTETIRRAAQLAIESGNPFKVIERLNQVNGEQMKLLEERVKLEIVEAGGDIDDESSVTVAMMEAMKTDNAFRNRLFEKLEKEVPELTEAFLKERDMLMAEALRRETTKGARHIVGVVGLAHVLGILENLKQMEESTTSKQSEER